MHQPHILLGLPLPTLPTLNTPTTFPDQLRDPFLERLPPLQLGLLAFSHLASCLSIFLTIFISASSSFLFYWTVGRLTWPENCVKEGREHVLHGTREVLSI